MDQNFSKIVVDLNNAMAEEFEKDPASFSPEANLRQTLEIDSLDVVDLIVIIEKVSGVKLVKEDFENIVTFDDLYNRVAKGGGKK